MNCHKCDGTGYYGYDDVHSKVCEVCCSHDGGWWELTEYYYGYQSGKNNLCCQKGCGTLFRDLKDFEGESHE